MDTEDLRDWLALSMTPGLGPSGCRELSNYLGTPGNVLKSSRQAIETFPGLKKSAREGLAGGPRYQAADQEIARAADEGVRILHWGGSQYPDWLRSIHNPPVILYVKGRSTLLGEPGVGVVGARAASDYGKKIAGVLALGLARHGLTVISGLALGIDTAAHHGALSESGNSIAVLGCGVDVVYPGQNRQLYQMMAEKGALVSEYPLGTKPESFRFPARNRIISGLSQGVVVVEAARHSGSLITAHLALEQGREVFAVPGRIDSVKSEGTHRLLKEGAKLVHSVEDIMEELPVFLKRGMQGFPAVRSPQPIADNLNQEEKALFIFLDAYPKTIEEIILGTGLSPQKSGELLLHLELKGLVYSLPGNRYQRTQ